MILLRSSAIYGRIILRETESNNSNSAQIFKKYYHAGEKL